MTTRGLTTLPYEDFSAQVPPHNLEAELACLGACLLGRPELLDAISELVEPDDFYDNRHCRLYELILSLRPQRVDSISVMVEVEARSMGAYITTDLLEQAIAHIPNVSGAEAYAQKISHLARCRRAQYKLRTLADRLYRADEAEYEAVVDEVAAALDLPPSRQFADVRLLGEVALEEVQEAKQRKPGEIIGDTWGFKNIDRLTKGLQPAKFYLIAGRPGMGKSAWALEVVRATCGVTHKPWLIVTLEMMLQELTIRQIASVGGVDKSRWESAQLNPNEWARVDTAAMKLAEAPLYATDRCTTLQDIRRRLKWIQDKHNGVLGGLMVDYLQLMSGPRKKNDNREQEVSALSGGMKRISMEFGCPVIGLSQLSRQVESRDDKRPKMWDLRESGSLEQDSDVIALLYREGYYDKTASAEGPVEVNIAKHRGGKTGVVKLHFKPDWQRFSEIEERYD